jgi:hypothetical protein
MRLRSATLLLTIGASPLAAQSWAVDQGTFVVAKGTSAGLTESFTIKRGAGGLITATGNQTLGTLRTTSSLTTDSVGTPAQYELQVRKQGAMSLRVVAMANGTRRLTTRSSASTSGGEESMREYPVAFGHTLVIEPGLLHHYFFLALNAKSGRVQVIEPGAARSVTALVTSRGLDNISVAGKPATATRYSVSGLAADADFWVDAQGRLLRVDVPSQGLSATREEPPR